MVKSDKEYFKKPKRFPSLKSPSGFLIYSLSDFTIISNIYLGGNMIIFVVISEVGFPLLKKHFEHIMYNYIVLTVYLSLPPPSPLPSSEQNMFLLNLPSQ